MGAAWERHGMCELAFSALLLQLAKPHVENQLLYKHSDPVTGFPGVEFT
jgi:hypothetical protein